jgi:4-hydroxy-3-methylbut-2-enyl diphosphate reductase
MEKKYFRSGLGARKEVEGEVNHEYSASLIDYIKKHDFHLKIGRFDFVLAREFGFCYGVERAVNYSYQVFQKFPDKKVFLTGEIIHNPQVNKKLLDMGVRFLSGPDRGENKKEEITGEDVVIIPAFGVPVEDLLYYRQTGCTIVDTTCGSVIVVWKNVEKYARDGFTALVHGKWYHEETRATCSQAVKNNGHYLVVLNIKEAEYVRNYLEGKMSRKDFFTSFENAVSPGFDPDRHLKKIGMANQTTMLMGETREISDFFEKIYRKKHGEKYSEYFRSMDTICSATQQRQDALKEMIEFENPDLFLIIGGYNSSNTGNLANIARKTGKRAFHIRGPGDLLSEKKIHCLPGIKRAEKDIAGWLPEGEVKIGLTAGASTPNSVVGRTIEKIISFEGLEERLEEMVGKTRKL